MSVRKLWHALTQRHKWTFQGVTDWLPSFQTIIISVVGGPKAGDSGPLFRYRVYQCWCGAEKHLREYK